MKELTIEQKAKAYDEAKARMIRAFNSNKCTIGFMNEIFPELKLKESEDEKIRKAVLNYLKKMWGNCKDDVCGVNVEDAIAWLEKQDSTPKEVTCTQEVKVGNGNINALVTEKITIDKVEPKFKLGDWVVDSCGYVLRIKGIIDQFYILEGIEGEESRSSMGWVNKNFHRWTVSENAKPGDVLCVKYGNDEMPFIFTGKQDDIAYCALNSFGEFVLSIADWLLKTSVLPATKKQRDTLFAKMKEAGYKWDSEKKKLEKIEQNLAWSEEDESYLNTTIAYLKDAKEFKKNAENYINWLKSLKPQNTWKPSEDQMNALANALSLAKNCGEEGGAFDLRTLYEQLNELKEQKGECMTDKVQKEHVSENLGDYINELSKQFQEVSFAKLSRISVRVAKWQKEHLWKPADSDDLPEYDREVIVLTQSYPLEGSEFAVSFAHRPNPKGWDGKSIIDGKITHLDAKTYDKGGWNQPNVKYWLDVEFPKE